MYYYCINKLCSQEHPDLELKSTTTTTTLSEGVRFISLPHHLTPSSPGYGDMEPIGMVYKYIVWWCIIEYVHISGTYIHTVRDVCKVFPL